MPIRPSTFPMRFSPKGLADALDATDKFPGACVALTDFIFDQLNPEIVVARPGVKKQADFAAAAFSSPGVISVQITVGDITYGLIASALNSGKDEPFAYNNATSAFVAVTGVTNGNTPTTQLTSGAWTPPTMAVIGTLLIVTHPGFPGGATKIGWFDISTPTAPTWTAGDVATNALPSTPTWVANFSNRAYYGCGQTVPYSDVLAGTTRTTSTQALTIGDTSVTTAGTGLPVQTTSGGVTQALIIFKASQIWQVTGDPVSNDLALNFLSLTLGTRAPRSVAQSAFGIYFTGDGGPYVIDSYGAVRALTAKIGDAEPDIVAPFQNALTPSRVAACYASSVYRVCLETIIRGTQSVNDYWFHENRRRWTGPHSFRFDCASQYQNYMILASNANPGYLYKSELYQSTSSAYNDDGTTFTPTLESSTFPKEGHMTQKQVVESTIELANGGAITTYNIQALNDQRETLDSVNITVASAGKLWGSFVWGDGTLWTSSTNRPHVYTVPWTVPINFQKMALFIRATATAALAIGTFFARYQDAGYVNPPNPPVVDTGTPIDSELSLSLLVEQ
jgi:hypothetical protein